MTLSLCTDLIASEILIIYTRADVELEKEALDLSDLLVQSSYNLLKNDNHSIVNPRSINARLKHTSDFEKLSELEPILIAKKVNCNYVISSNLRKEGKKFKFNIILENSTNGVIESFVTLEEISIQKIKFNFENKLNNLLDKFIEKQEINVDLNSNKKEKINDTKFIKKQPNIKKEKEKIVKFNSNNNNVSVIKMIFNLFFNLILYICTFLFIVYILISCVSNNEETKDKNEDNNSSQKLKNNYPYQCNNCGRSYKTANRYQKHFNIYH